MENLLQDIASGLWIVLGVYCFFGLRKWNKRFSELYDELKADDNEYLYYRYFSQCQKCGAGAKRGHTKEDAVKEWNRRADNGDKESM